MSKIPGTDIDDLVHRLPPMITEETYQKIKHAQLWHDYACAVLGGLNAFGDTESLITSEMSVTIAIDQANAMLAEYKKRWEG